jgi:hypothetical protein
MMSLLGVITSEIFRDLYMEALVCIYNHYPMYPMDIELGQIYSDVKIWAII